MKYALCLVVVISALLVSACNTFAPSTQGIAPLRVGTTVTKYFTAPEIDSNTAVRTGRNVSVTAGTSVRYSQYCVDVTVTNPDTGRMAYIIRSYSLIEVNDAGTWKLIEVPQPVVVD